MRDKFLALTAESGHNSFGMFEINGDTEMVNNHGGNDLLDTTDCLEAVGVFKGWKNLLFLIVLLCLLLLQAGFYLVDRDFIKISDQVYTDGPAVEDQTAQPDEGSSKIGREEDSGVDPSPDEDWPTENELLEDVIGEPNETIQAIEPNEPVEPNEPNEPAEPNELVERGSVLRRIEPRIRATAPQVQRAGQWFPKEFISEITFGQLAWIIRLVNAVLILTATLYCLTLLFSLKVSMHGRLGGINHISRAFFLSLLMVVLLLPWQRIFGSVVTGAIFTPEELVKWCSAKNDDILDVVLYYLRFSGYGVLMLLLLILSQLRSLRWAKAILRRLEII